MSLPQIFPNESDGNNYDLNWSLNADGVCPSGVAYAGLNVSGGKGELRRRRTRGVISLFHDFGFCRWIQVRD